MPGLGIVLTIGRCLTIGMVGVVLGLALINQLPWLLPAHFAICTVMFFFLRIMITPRSSAEDAAMASAVLSGGAGALTGGAGSPGGDGAAASNEEVQVGVEVGVEKAQETANSEEPPTDVAASMEGGGGEGEHHAEEVTAAVAAVAVDDPPSALSPPIPASP